MWVSQLLKTRGETGEKHRDSAARAAARCNCIFKDVPGRQAMAPAQSLSAQKLSWRSDRVIRWTISLPVIAGNATAPFVLFLDLTHAC